MDSPLIIALDGKTPEESLELAEKLKDYVWGFKVNDLFFEMGWEIVEALGKLTNVMLDVKLFDIPNTVGNIAARFSTRPVDLVTVHATGGEAMIRQAVHHMKDKVVAVTCLTSFDDEACDRSYNLTPETVVTALAKIAKAGGASYVVCSPKELGLACFNKKQPWAFQGKKIVPGIRPLWFQMQGADDQERTMTPEDAMTRGADMLVMGRPILQSPDPLEAVQRTLEEIEQRRRSTGKFA